MSVKNRLDKAVKQYAASRPETFTIFTVFPNYVISNGETITRAAYEAMPKRDKDIVMIVKYAADNETSQTA